MSGTISFHILSETLLDSDQDINITGFSVLRCDRNRHGGGVCLYIAQYLSPVVINDSSCNNALVETVWVEIT